MLRLTKFEIEKYVNVKNNTLDKFKRKWATNGNLLLNIYSVCIVISGNAFLLLSFFCIIYLRIVFNQLRYVLCLLLVILSLCIFKK